MKHSGHEKGGVKGSRKGIKHGMAGRQLHETEHHDRMNHEVGSHEAYPTQDGGNIHPSSPRQGEVIEE